jgi:hypothetical protein
VSVPPADAFTIDALGRWSYAFCVSLYLGLLGALLWYFRHTFRFAVWRFYMVVTVNTLLVLGFFFEWMADVFFVWDFPPGRHLFKVPVPIFGWLSGHRVPVEELLWIVAVVPLFYYLYLWSTLLFHDIVYVVDERGNFYKREERLVGFLQPTKITTRLRGRRGQEHEVILKTRPPGFIARLLKRFVRDGTPPPTTLAE